MPDLLDGVWFCRQILCMSEKRTFIRSASIVAAITSLSRVLGLVRDATIGALLGATRVSDCFWLAYELPNLARRVLGEGSLSAFIVPLFSAERREKGEKEGWRYAANALTAITILGAVLTILGCLFAKPLFLLFGGLGIVFRDAGASGATESAEAILLGARLTRVMFPYLMLLAVSALLMGLCHTLKKFTAPAFGSVLINVSMIGAGGLFWLLHRQDIAASASDPAIAEAYQTRFAFWLAGSVLIGIALRVLVHVPTLWSAGFRFGPELELRHPRLVELFRKMPLAVAGVAVAQVMISINKFFAMFMEDGYVTHLNNANRIAQLPLGILASAMATAILPQLTQFLQEDKRDELRSLFGFAMRLLTILFLPAAVGLIVLGEPIVALLFQRLAWTSEATAGTAWALLFYAMGLLPAAGLRLATPLYYARLDLRTPVKAGIIAVCVNLALNLIFFKFTNLRQGGLALATALAMTANLGMLLYWMRGEVGGAFDRRLGETVWKCLTAAIVMGVIAKGFLIAAESWLGPLDSFVERAIFIAVTIPLCAGAYFALGAALRIPDLGQAIGLLRRRGSRV